MNMYMYMCYHVYVMPHIGIQTCNVQVHGRRSVNIETSGLLARATDSDSQLSCEDRRNLDLVIGVDRLQFTRYISCTFTEQYVL